MPTTISKAASSSSSYSATPVPPTFPAGADVDEELLSLLADDFDVRTPRIRKPTAKMIEMEAGREKEREKSAMAAMAAPKGGGGAKGKNKAAGASAAPAVATGSTGGKAAASKAGREKNKERDEDVVMAEPTPEPPAKGNAKVGNKLKGLFPSLECN
jgi:hypothetical protein